MKIQNIEEIANRASKLAGESLSKLSNEEVVVTNSSAKEAEMSEVYKGLVGGDKKEIVVYSRIYESINGISLLVFKRADALKLVDLLNGDSIGTTGIIKDVDRSAIKETFNILVNKYMTEIAKVEEEKMIVEAPVFATGNRLEELVEKFTTREVTKDKAITFDVNMKIANHNIEISIFIVFD